MSDSLLSIKEAADFLKVHWQTVRAHINSGKLKASKVGRRVRILESDLEEFAGLRKKTDEIHEVEIRFMTNKRQQIEEKLLKMGGKVVYHGHVIDHWFVPNEIRNIEEKNEWFDSAKGYGLRIREQDNGYTGKMTTTLEVKRLVEPNQHDTCLEGELGISNYDEGNSLLRMMNMKEMVVLDKDRLVYRLNEVKVVIDDIKNFKVGVEIEEVTGKPREEVVPKLRQLAEKIGLDTAREMTDKSVTYLYMTEYSKF